MQESFYWHDYETSGTDFVYDRPVQFAGIRTNYQLEQIGEPLVVYCKPPQDCLPNPESTLITGITPQDALEKGLAEYEFAQRIHKVFSEPGTCRVGYNNIGFDDHITRYLFHRNFYAPYDCEWQDGNSRWDILNMMRACGAFRPEGIAWYFGNSGQPGYSLERLASVNGVKHDQAHDALSDVHATLGLARLVKTHQPQLFEYALNLRNVKLLRKNVALDAAKPLLHVAFHYTNAQYCVGMVLPLMDHPTQRNQTIFYDLSVPPEKLLNSDADTLASIINQRSESHKYGLLTIALNQSPFLVSTNILNDAIIERIQLPFSKYMERAAQITGELEACRTCLNTAYKQNQSDNTSSPDADHLYGNGLASDADTRLFPQIRSETPEALAQKKFDFANPNYAELLFRYRGRNFPTTLNDSEQQLWQDFCHKRLHDTQGDGLDVQSYLEHINQLRVDPQTQRDKLPLLDAMEQWLDVLKN